MKKILIALGLATAALAPLAASAHTDLSIGLGLGGPVYYEPAPVYYYEPEPEVVYYDYYGPHYYRAPRYESRVIYHQYREPHYYRHHRHDDRRDWDDDH